jgi:HEAT repeat protein
VISARDPAQRAHYLTLLCNAGDQGFWGIETLLAHPDPAIRQQGTLVLHHVRTARARARLTELLSDPDAAQAELAAVGLAIHGDDSAVAPLQALFETGSPDAARAAAVALGRLATPAAIAALSALASMPLDVDRTAALLDACRDAGPGGAAVLLTLLDDDRPLTRPPRYDAEMAEVLAAVGAGAPTSSDALADLLVGQTVAGRAAAILAEMTGVQFAITTMPAADRNAARAVWEAALSRAAAEQRP